MKKGKFKILVTGKTGDTFKEVSGLLSDHFGIYKKKKNHYSVTHLKTGYNASLPYDKQKQARQFIKEAENIPGIETLDLTNAYQFEEEMKKIAWKIIKNT